MTAAALLDRLARAGVVAAINNAGGLHLSGTRPRDDLLAEVRTNRDALIRLVADRSPLPCVWLGGCDEVPPPGATRCRRHTLLAPREWDLRFGGAS